MVLRVDHIKHAYCCVLLTTTSFGFEHGHKRWTLGPATASHPWSTADPSGCVQQNVGCSGLSAAATTYPGSPPSEGCGPQPASHCTCCRRTLQLLAAGSASGLQASSDRTHAAPHASPLSASTSVTPAGSCGVAGSAVSGLPALKRRWGPQYHHGSHKNCTAGCMDGVHIADSGTHRAPRSSGCRAPGTRSRAPCCARSCDTCPDSTRRHSATGPSPPCSNSALLGMLARYHLEARRMSASMWVSENTRAHIGAWAASTCRARGTPSSPPPLHCWPASCSMTRTAHKLSSSCRRRCTCMRGRGPLLSAASQLLTYCVPEHYCAHASNVDQLYVLLTFGTNVARPSSSSLRSSQALV